MDLLQKVRKAENLAQILPLTVLTFHSGAHRSIRRENFQD